jgi:hypothetical protein
VTDFLDEKRDEIELRLAELKPVIEEYNRLLAAAAALRGVEGTSVTGAVLSMPSPIESTPSESAPSAASVDEEEPEEEPAPAPLPAAAPLRRGPGRPRGGAPASLAAGAGSEQGDGVSSRDIEPSSGEVQASTTSSTEPDGPRRAGRPKGSGTRAAEALRIVREHPGVTIPELADRMGIKQNYLYRVLPELVQEGKIAKQGRGWHPRAA